MEQEPAKTPHEIGRIVSTYFKENGISQENVAERLGLSSKQVVANQLNGKRFGRRVAAKYANEFGFNEQFLMTGKGELLNAVSSTKERTDEVDIAFLKELVKTQLETIKNLSAK